MRDKMENYASIEAICDGAPVYSFNHLIYVHGESPDFYPGSALQECNENPIRKLKLKRVWDMKNNFIGFCHEMTPRTRLNDSQPYLPIHLIDGDPETIWSSFECFEPDAAREWIRIDLPIESMVSRVRLVTNPRFMGRGEGFYFRPQWHFGNALPRNLTVKLSRDAWHWDTVFDCDDMYNETDSMNITLDEPIPAKQILISFSGGAKLGYEGYCFSMSGAEALDENGENIALVSRGAGVTVSSTSGAHNPDRYSANSLWGPLQYDIGNKWVKIGSDNGSPLWCFTEHEKGILEAGADLDAAVTEAYENGMNIIMTLDFKGNWIYEDPPRKQNWREARFRETNESYMCGVPLADQSPEMFAGYLRYVEYMVRHFKDRVAVFEIGNEWGQWYGSLNQYKNAIFEPTYDLIKSFAPDVKLALCGTAGFLTEEILTCLGPGVLAEGGRLTAPLRMLAYVKGLDVGDVAVSVDAECVSPHGIALRCSGRDNFTACVYDPGAGVIYIVERRVKDVKIFDIHKDFLLECEHKVVIPAKGLARSVHMAARIEGNQLTFTVTDGSGTAVTACDLNDCADSGSVGIFQYPGPENGAYSAFRAVDPVGKLLFESNFSDETTLAGQWELYWNHWGDRNKPIAAQRLDMVCWHTGELPTNEYFDKVRKFRKDCEALGFRGEYSCNEIYAGAVYPPGPVANNQFRLSDVQEAKYYINTMVGHAALNIESGPCHVHFPSFPHPQAVCRSTVASQVVAPQQPKPSYYAIRNICTAMDGFYEADYSIKLSDETSVVAFAMENYDKTERLIALYLEAAFADHGETKTVDFRLEGISAKAVWGIDTFNGTEQAIHFMSDGGGISMKGILLRDYPIMLRVTL